MYIVYNARTHLDIAKFFSLADAKRYAAERKEDTGNTYFIYQLKSVLA
jgi:hypothetical protein